MITSSKNYHSFEGEAVYVLGYSVVSTSNLTVITYDRIAGSKSRLKCIFLAIIYWSQALMGILVFTKRENKYFVATQHLWIRKLRRRTHKSRECINVNPFFRMNISELTMKNMKVAWSNHYYHCVIQYLIVSFQAFNSTVFIVIFRSLLWCYARNVNKFCPSKASKHCAL